MSSYIHCTVLTVGKFLLDRSTQFTLAATPIGNDPAIPNEQAVEKVPAGSHGAVPGAKHSDKTDVWHGAKEPG